MNAELLQLADLPSGSYGAARALVAVPGVGSLPDTPYKASLPLLVGENIASHGALTNGTDCAASLIAALAVSNVIDFPAGTFTFQTPVSAGGKDITLRGAGKGTTTIVFTHGGVGFTFAQGSVFNTLNVQGITFRPQNANGPTAAAIDVSWTAISSYGGPTLTMLDCEFAGTLATPVSPYPNTFTDVVRVTNGWQVHLARVTGFGTPPAGGVGGLTGTSMLRLTRCFGITLSDCVAYQYDGMVRQSGYCEGLFITGSTTVGCNTTITQDTGFTQNAGFNLIGLWLTDNELNNYRSGVAVAFTRQGQVVANHFGRYADSGSLGYTSLLYTSCDTLAHSANVIAGGGGDAPVFSTATGINLAGGTNGVTFDASNTIVNSAIGVVMGTSTYGNFCHVLTRDEAPVASFTDSGQNTTFPNTLRWVTFAGTEAQKGNRTFAGAEGQAILTLAEVVNAVNYFGVVPSTAGSPISLLAIGPGPNIDIQMLTKGTGKLTVQGNPVITTATIGAGLAITNGLLVATATGGSSLTVGTTAGTVAAGDDSRLQTASVASLSAGTPTSTDILPLFDPSMGSATKKVTIAALAAAIAAINTPLVVATGATLVGAPSTATVNTAVSGVTTALTPSGATAYASLTVGGAEQTPRTTFTGTSVPTLTPLTAGTATISIYAAATGGSALVTSSNITVSAVTATAYTLALSLASTVVGSPTTLTFTPTAGVWPGSETITPVATSVAGAFSPTSLTPTGSGAVTCTFTPSAAATGSLSATTSPTMTNSSGSQTFTATTAPVAPLQPALTMTGASYGAGKFGQALTGGKGVATLAVTSGPTAFSCWVKAAAPPPADFVQRPIVVFNTTDGLLLRDDGSGTVGIFKSNGAAYSSVNVCDGTWHHLAYQNSPGGANECVLYIDGVVSTGFGSATVLGATPSIVVSAAGSTSTLLSAANAPGYMQIDDVQVFSGLKYTNPGNFTPPTAAGATTDAMCVGLYHLDGSGASA